MMSKKTDKVRHTGRIPNRSLKPIHLPAIHRLRSNVNEGLLGRCKTIIHQLEVETENTRNGFHLTDKRKQLKDLLENRKTRAAKQRAKQHCELIKKLVLGGTEEQMKRYGWNISRRCSTNYRQCRMQKCNLLQFYLLLPSI